MLMQSIYWGREELAQEMIESGVDINFTVSDTRDAMPNWSPIHCAAYKGRSKIVQLLLKTGSTTSSDSSNEILTAAQYKTCGDTVQNNLNDAMTKNAASKTIKPVGIDLVSGKLNLSCREDLLLLSHG
ncbi:hypothetical protein OCU04_011896 [Sclerotinia nivalis]|uniref:Ankyrin repeat protein n=1 Tax=Sclerotinia nivalis TaxID=352851 RepID=A0A9X0A9U9_9HELO|nr:hypothetical protein OCU04_011896 [Sclerotinia nivalis]